MKLSVPDGPLTVLALSAHPDDLEIAAGGTLLRLASRGATAACLTLTGEEERTNEANQAIEAFLPGATLELGGFRDGYLPASWGEVKRRLHEFAEKHPRPDLVLVPWHDDAHQDHRLLGELAPTVWRSSLLLHYEIPKWDGDVGRPHLYVELDRETAVQKCRLLDECFPSQRARDWWDDELFLGFMRMRGVECKTRYAEAFHLSKATLSV